MAQDNRFDLVRLEQIERRLQVLEDVEAIRNLKARYAALCDNQYDADGIASLFTEDAIWESPALGRFEGRDAIRSFFRGASGIFSFAIHYSLNGQIEVVGDTARACWYLFMPCTVAAGNRAMWRAGIDHETYRPGGWNLDVPSQAVRAADERPVRDRLGDGAFRVTGVTRRSYLNEITSVPKQENAT
jgi:ketosteroid isomerase-like protein